MVKPSMGLFALGEVMVMPSPTPKLTGAEAEPWKTELPFTVIVPPLHRMLARTTLSVEDIVNDADVRTCVCTFNEPICLYFYRRLVLEWHRRAYECAPGTYESPQVDHQLSGRYSFRYQIYQIFSNR